MLFPGNSFKALLKTGQNFFKFFEQVRSCPVQVTKCACLLSSARPSWHWKRPMWRGAAFRVELPGSVAKKSPSLALIRLHWCRPRLIVLGSERSTMMSSGPLSDMVRPPFRNPFWEQPRWTPSRTLSLPPASMPSLYTPALEWPSLS